uniref:RNA-directed RNA polymerase n=1 Tax=Diatom colony associated virus-Like RNA Segment 4 TaxID=1678184 RepID=A0A146J6K5_9VIRU|nr:RNA dependent RNA polymerase [Diatom colony associated virus-Like RNA Segment 4]
MSVRPPDPGGTAGLVGEPPSRRRFRPGEEVVLGRVRALPEEHLNVATMDSYADQRNLCGRLRLLGVTLNDLNISLVSTDRSARIAERVDELGSFGVGLLEALPLEALYDPGSMSTDVAVFSTLFRRGKRLSAMAYSMLSMEFPMQVPGDDNDVLRLFNVGVPTLSRGEPRPVAIWDREARKAAFPLKSHPGASNKVNVYLSEVYFSTKAVNPAVTDEFVRLSGHIAGTASDDQASGILLAAHAMSNVVSEPVDKAMRLFLNLEAANSLTLCIKSLGLNGTLTGGCLVEGKTLQGRGLPSKVATDWRYRTDPEAVRAKVHDLPPDKLRSAIREVMQTELPKGEMSFPSLEETWTSRWMWCINGAHSKLIETLHPELARSSDDLLPGQVHRRVFAESLKDNPILEWDARSYFTGSDKLEAGATRAIYSGDSLSYFAFEHLLRPVERAWKGRRVILDPGEIGTWGMGRRIKRMRHQGGVNVMLDYDDMNARHSLGVMKMVFEELVLHTKYDPVLGQRLVDSFDEWWIKSPEDGELVKIAGTLMSGHRATTFINSVLNYAYIRVASSTFADMQSMHVGDDVYLLAPSYRAAYDLLARCKAAGLAMNPMKQSVGEYTSEFLRVAYRPTRCQGYLLRSVSACVAGNWVSELKLNYEEGLRAMIGHAWTLANRSNNSAAGMALRASFKRMARLTGAVADKLITGEWALPGEAARYKMEDTHVVHIDWGRRSQVRELDKKIFHMEQSATVDYLSYHTTPIEALALTELRTSVEREMKRASYGKTMASQLNKDPSDVEPLRARVKVRPVKGMFLVQDIWDKPLISGVLSHFPLLQLVKNKIRSHLLSDLVHSETGEWLTGRRCYERAWGTKNTGATFRGRISFADAGRISARCNGQLVDVHYPCFV